MKLGKILASGSALALAAFLAMPTAASADVITNGGGTFSVGIGGNGELFDFASGTGFRRNGDGYDPLLPGTPRDSWGVTTSDGSAYADQAAFGDANLTGTTFSGGGSSETAITTTNVGVQITQSYAFVGSGNILRIQETITNTSGSALTGVAFARDVDWDVSPTAFNENTFGPTGSSPLVIGSSYYGFENPTAGVPYSFSCSGSCNTTGDLGGGIQVGLPDLAAGGSDTFDFFYGVSGFEQSVNGLIGEAQHQGANYIIATQSSENGNYPDLGANSALIGVGQVPEPITISLFGAGLAGMGAFRRRRKSA